MKTPTEVPDYCPALEYMSVSDFLKCRKCKTCVINKNKSVTIYLSYTEEES